MSTAATEKATAKDVCAGRRIFNGRIVRVRSGKSWTFAETAPTEEAAPEAEKPTRAARLLAFAHKLQAAIDKGEYRDQADVARQLGVSRARVTQLLDMTLLAPDIQEQVLCQDKPLGHGRVRERSLRDVLRLESWEDQRRLWSRITSG